MNWKNVGGALAAMATGAASAATGVKMLPPEPSWFEMVVLGIPLGVLAASHAGSSARSLRDESQPDRTLIQRAVATIIDGFIGGWLAMFIVGFSVTKSYFVGVAPSIIGAFGGLLTEYVRTNGSRWAEQLWQTFLSWIARKRAGDTP